MTREEAKEALSVLKIYDNQWLREAIDMAIEALQAKTDGDLISRADPSAVCDDCIWTVCNYNKVDWDTPSAEAEWILCSERLPEEHEWVGTKKFGTTISDKVHITFDVNGERFVKTLSLQNGELSNYEKQTMDTLYKGWKMIAWMPLPEPYREDGEA